MKNHRELFTESSNNLEIRNVNINIGQKKLTHKHVPPLAFLMQSDGNL